MVTGMLVPLVDMVTVAEEKSAFLNEIDQRG